MMKQQTFGTSMFKAAALAACFASAVSFDNIGPMLAKDDCIARRGNRSAIHLLFCHRIQLLEFSVLPFLPIGKASEFSSSEAPETLFVGRAMRCRVERAKQHLGVIIVDLGSVVRESKVAGDYLWSQR